MQKVFGSNIVISSSVESPGIQTIDTLLWLFNKIQSEQELGFECGRLMQHALRKGYYTDFSFNGFYQKLEAEIRPIMDDPISDEKLESAKELVTLFNSKSGDEFPDLHSLAASKLFARE